MLPCVVVAIVSLLLTIVLIKGYFWVLAKGSYTGKLVVALAAMTFFLCMAKFNAADSRWLAGAFCAGALVQLLAAMVAFNVLFPTKGKSDEH